MNWINEQIQWLKSFFSESDGKASIKRLISFLIAVAYLQAYVKVSIINSKLEDIPTNWSFTLLGIIGLGIASNFFGGKNDKQV